MLCLGVSSQMDPGDIKRQNYADDRGAVALDPPQRASMRRLTEQEPVGGSLRPNGGETTDLRRKAVMRV